jgi:glycosyltransferase involved in cell wall biosynthesis
VTLRVLLLAPCPFPTSQGTQVYVGGLARALLAAGLRPQILCYGGADGPAVDERDGVPILRARRLPGQPDLRAGPSWQKLPQDLDLVRLLWRHGPGADLLHAHNVEAPVIAATAAALAAPSSRRRPVPTLFHAHNLMVDELVTYARGRAAQLVARVAAPVLDHVVPRLAHRVAVLTEAARNRLVDIGVPGGRVDVLPPGLTPSELDVAWAPGPVPTVVYAGNPDGYQGLPTLFRAVALVRERRPEVRLRLVSASGWDEHEAELRSLGLVGEVVERVRASAWTQVREALRSAWVCAVPRPASAGFPMKLLNCMGLGVPTVCARGSAVVGRPDAELIVAADADAHAFAHALLRALDPQVARPIGEAARTLILARHRWDQRAAAVISAYERTLAAVP